MQKETTIINHKKTVEQMFLIFDMSHDSRLILEVDSEDDLNRVDEIISLNDAVNFISDLFHITPIQSCLLSIVFGSQMNNNEMSFEKILDYLDLELPNFFDLQQEMQGLIDKRILKVKGDNTNTKNLYHSIFTINPKVIDALFNNKSVEEAMIEPETSFVPFCGHISRVIRSFSMRRLTIYDLVEQVYEIENKNQNLIAIQSLKELQVPIEERIVLYSLTESLTHDNESMVNLSNLIKQIFGSSNYPFILSTFLNGEHDLQRKRLIKVNKEANHLVEDLTIELTTKAITILLGDSASFYNSSPSTTHHHCICCESHAAKPYSLSNIRKSIKKLLSRFGKKSQTKNTAN